MSYKELYDYCQTLEPKIGRNAIKDRVLQLKGNNRVATMKTTLDTTKCRGFYLSARNAENRIVQQHGSCVIVLARGMNTCWDRFVYIKELMHIFDDPKEATDTGEIFEKVLGELSAGSPDPSPQTTSEWMCFWMALGVLCPEELRQQLARERADKHTDDYAIALKLRMPQLYVPLLFDARYENLIQKAINKAAPGDKAK